MKTYLKGEKVTGENRNGQIETGFFIGVSIESTVDIYNKELGIFSRINPNSRKVKIENLLENPDVSVSEKVLVQELISA